MCLAAGLGEMAAHPEETIGVELRWVMCAGLALHFAVTGVSGLAAGAPRRWLLGWALPVTVCRRSLAAVGASLSNGRLTLGLLLCVGWMVGYGRLSRRRAAST